MHGKPPASIQNDKHSDLMDIKGTVKYPLAGVTESLANQRERRTSGFEACGA